VRDKFYIGRIDSAVKRIEESKRELRKAIRDAYGFGEPIKWESADELPPRGGEGTVAGWNGESLILTKVDGKLHEIHFSLIVQETETEKETKE
jgi:hypothetical protein